MNKGFPAFPYERKAGEQRVRIRFMFPCSLITQTEGTPEARMDK